MKAFLPRISAVAWLVIVYVILGVTFLWAANQPPGQPATGLFIGCLAGCWLPAFVYSNRLDMARNKVFWISHTVAGVVALVAWLLIVPWWIQLMDDGLESASKSGGWAGLVVAGVIYFVINGHVQLIVAKIFSTTETVVDKHLSKPGPTAPRMTRRDPP